MKCPDCGSDLNVKDTVPLAARGGLKATVCVFCGTVASLGEADDPPRALAACLSCGAPASGPDFSETRGLCEGCADESASTKPAAESLDQLGETTLREALRLYPALASGRSTAYFEKVLGTLALACSEHAGSYRLIVVSDLGFRSLSIPGGTILAGVEMLCALEDEAALAFALGREIAHQKSGRAYRRFASRRPSGPLSAGFEWGLSLITGAEGTGKRRQDVLREVGALGYGAAHEEEADAAGIEGLVRGGYDPMAAVRYLTVLERRDMTSRGPIATLLDVRPARSRRRERAEALAAFHLEAATLVRINREAYRRATALLASEAVPTAGVLAGRPARERT